jgi:hypothetical protein
MQCPVVPIHRDSRLSESIACAGQAQSHAASAPSIQASSAQSPDAESTRIEYDADLLVVGCGPAGQAAAFQAAKAKKKVTVIDERGAVGGVCVHAGTIPSKTLREAARRLLLECKGVQNVCPEDMLRLWWTVEKVITSEVEHIRDDFSRNNIRFIGGRGSLVDPQTLRVIIPRGENSASSTELFCALQQLFLPREAPHSARQALSSTTMSFSQAIKSCQ